MYQGPPQNRDVLNSEETFANGYPGFTAFQESHSHCPQGTVCLLLFRQSVAEAISHSLNARGQHCLVIRPCDAEAFLRHNCKQISLVVLAPQVSNHSSIDFSDFLDLTNIPFVLLGNSVRSVNLAKSLKTNARGYLTYGCPLDTLLSVITKIASGKIEQHWCPDALKMIDDSGRTPKVKQENTISSLTNRQIEVLTHLAEGKTVKEVARILHLSHKSVDSHKYRIMNRLHLHDRVHLSRAAIREGLIEA